MHPDGCRVLTATLHDATVMLSFRLGIADGITVLCRRSSESEFLTVAEDDDSPVVDSRPKLSPDQPEIRLYRAVLHYDDGETLQLSNEIRVVVP